MPFLPFGWRSIRKYLVYGLAHSVYDKQVACVECLGSNVGTGRCSGSCPYFCSASKENVEFWICRLSIVCRLESQTMRPAFSMINNTLGPNACCNVGRIVWRHSLAMSKPRIFGANIATSVGRTFNTQSGAGLSRVGRRRQQLFYQFLI